MTTTGVLGTRPAVSDDAVRAAMELAFQVTEPYEAEARWARVVAMAESRRLVAVADATEQDPDPLAGKRLSVPSSYMPRTGIRGRRRMPR